MALSVLLVDALGAGHCGVLRVAVSPMTVSTAKLSFRKRKLTKKVVLHSSHTPPSQSNLEAFLAVKGRTIGLLEIGYHFLILRDGKQIMCRPHDCIGAHSDGYDRESIGVCLAGGVEEPCADFICKSDGFPCAVYEPCRLAVPKDNFTADQWDSLKTLMAYLRDNYGGLRLWGHSELPRHKFRERRCPPVDMDSVRAALR